MTDQRCGKCDNWSQSEMPDWIIGEREEWGKCPFQPLLTRSSYRCNIPEKFKPKEADNV